MSTMKKPQRTWMLVVSLGVPLVVVGASAMAISYATLIDVAKVNGLPLPELFPVLVDVGTVASMISAAQFKLRGLQGKWLAYVTFILLSVVSVGANASHAWATADMTRTTPVVASVLAATPPFALLAITHLVMGLVPDEKERRKLALIKEKEESRPSIPVQPVRQAVVKSEGQEGSVAEVLTPLFRPIETSIESIEEVGAVQKVANGQEQSVDSDVVFKVQEYVSAFGKKPTGALVGEWLGGKSAKTGQRFLANMGV